MRVFRLKFVESTMTKEQNEQPKASTSAPQVKKRPPIVSDAIERIHFLHQAASRLAESSKGPKKGLADRTAGQTDESHSAGETDRSFLENELDMTPLSGHRFLVIHRLEARPNVPNGHDGSMLHRNESRGPWDPTKLLQEVQTTLDRHPRRIARFQAPPRQEPPPAPDLPKLRS
ncbi:hypothetical protein L596_016221 [Steinernema carpocapsae]|uniref:Uncharacterized protein n=1 Tax=Steinernema carpocapsae TaxID=34508 RepID=A0A4U5NIF5_STECR|nr:hypothetical protein L596_016221 [Steinernema carpocapsae]